MYDAIVVSARCAGSPTAMLLARRGYRVLLVDKSHFPSDMAMSTHWIHQPGIARLKRWGILGKLQQTDCLPLSQIKFDVGPFALTGCPPPADDVQESYGPRRTMLDQLLVEAALAASVEFRPCFSVQGVISDGEIVSGIHGSEKGGSPITERARVVIGADGRNSIIGKAVRAQKYNSKPPIQGTYFSYFSGVPIEGAELYAREFRMVYAWPTNDNLSLIGVNWAIADFHAVRHDIEGNYFKVLDTRCLTLRRASAPGNVKNAGAVVLSTISFASRTGQAGHS